jgi:pimeloyl-ACP methyl ester carboxylesterase
MSRTPMAMRSVSFDGVELQFDERGSGEPIVLIHGSAVKDDLLPVGNRLAPDGYRVIRYHRRGYGGSSPVQGSGPVSIADQSHDCVGLLRELGIERAHVVGHSTGGVIALQVALDAPDLVHSLILLEPALILIVPSGQAMMQQMTPVVEMYQGGHKAEAAGAFMQAISRPNVREIIDASIGAGAYDDALTMADMFFGIEMASLQGWSLGRDEAQRIRQPVLFVTGDETPPPFREVQELLAQLLPQMETVTVAGGTHIFDIEKPGETAQAIVTFLRANPIREVKASR